MAAASAAVALPAPAVARQLRVTLEDPAQHGPLTADGEPVEIRGRAEIFGAREGLDLFLVMDSSKSLRHTDPEDHQRSGARALAARLLAIGRTRIGIVDFDSHSRVLAGLTDRREPIFDALLRLDQKGRSDLWSGVDLALDRLERDAVPGSTRVVLVFTDGLADEGDMQRVLERARASEVAIHTVLLGYETRGEALLQDIAAATRGTFVRMTDPRATSAFLGLGATGVREVTLAVDGGAPVPARIAGSDFRARLPLAAGEHEIVARASAPPGISAEQTLRVSVRAPGCAALEVVATRDGRPTVSLADRNALIVLDASNSMWGRLESRTKLAVAREALLSLVASLPDDTVLGLRTYGHRHRFERRDCEDTELLVAPGPDRREPIRAAMAALVPKGQTPLAHALEQAGRDLADLPGERAIVLVTDGIESCGGDPAASAAALQAGGPLPVHVIGFGLARDDDEDAASLRAIAEASGGRFLTADSARTLRDALGGTVGTRYTVLSDDAVVAEGLLGGEPVRLEPGAYALRLEGARPVETPVRVEAGQRLVLALEIGDAGIAPRETRVPSGYLACGEEAPAPGSTDGAAAPERAAP